MKKNFIFMLVMIFLFINFGTASTALTCDDFKNNSTECFKEGCFAGFGECIPMKFTPAPSTYETTELTEKFETFLKNTPHQSFTDRYMDQEVTKTHGTSFRGALKTGFWLNEEPVKNTLFMKIGNPSCKSETIDNEFALLHKISQEAEKQELEKIHIPKNSKYWREGFPNKYLWYMVEYFQPPEKLQHCMQEENIVHKPREWTDENLKKFDDCFSFTSPELKNFNEGLEQVKTLLEGMYIDDLQIIPFNATTLATEKKGIAIIDPLKVILKDNLTDDQLKKYDTLVKNIEGMITFIKSKLEKLEN